MKFLAFLRFSWLRLGKRKTKSHANPGRRYSQAGLQVEAFEDRLLPSGTPVAAAFYPDLNPDNTPASTVNTGWLSSGTLAGPVHSVLSGSLPQFNPALGTLTSVDVEEVASFTTTGSLQNTSTSSTNTITAEADLTAALTSPTISDLQLSKFFAQQFAPFDASISGTPGDSTILNRTDSGLTATQTLTSPSDLAAFLGQSTVAIQEDINGKTTVSGLAQMNNSVTSTGSVQVEVRYHYLPADLAIVKTANPTSVQAGGPVTYTLTVTNNGPGAASNVVVQDSVPAGEVITGSTPPSGWTVQSTTGGVTFSDPSLAAGATATFTLAATAPPSVGQYTNTATVSTSTTDTNPNNNQATATIMVTAAQTDLGIVKSVTPATTLPNGTVTYTLTVTNNGTIDANNVVVQDTLPGGEVLSNTTAPVGWSAQSTTGAVTFSDPDLAAGASATFTVVVTAPSGAGQYTNTATVSSQTPDSNPANNQATAVITVTPAQTDDLAIVKSANPTNVLPNGAVTYTLTVTNNGPADASNVTVQDSLPAGEVLVGTTQPTGWTAQNTAGNLTFSDATLASGATATLTIAVLAPAPVGSYTNTATVTSQTPDSNPNNNVATSTITVTQAQTDDLSIVKSANPTNVLPNGAVTYTLTVTNNGPADASTVSVQDSLPAGEVLVGTTQPAGWGVQSSTGNLTFSDATLASGATATLTIAVLAPAAAGSVTNTATVTSQTPDSNPNNNIATSTITVTAPQADLAIVKTASPTSVQAGGAVTYTLTVSNLGPSDASTVTVQDMLPTGESFVSDTAPSGWTAQNSGGTVTFSGGSLAASATATFTIVVTAPPAAGTVTNTATVTSLTPDPNPNNNITTTTITVTPVPADLSIVKTASPTTVVEGGTVTYTLTVTNLGPGTASNVTVQDMLPAGEGFVSETPANGWTGQDVGGTVTFSGGSLAASATATFTVVVTAPMTAGTVTNTATVTSPTPDPNPNNNTTTTTITVTPPQADLAIVKTANPTSVVAGGAVTYTLTVTNLGPSTANTVTVQDTLPTGEIFVSDTAPSGWTAQHSAGAVTFTGTSLAPSATATFTIAVTAPTVGGSYGNTATVTSLTADPNLANNISTSNITVGVIDVGPPPVLPPPVTPPPTTPPPTTPPPTTPPPTTTTYANSKTTVLASSSWWLQMLEGG